MRRRYAVVQDNAWVRPIMRGYRMKCCDCGLIHEMDFKVIRWGRGHKVKYRARRLKGSGNRG